MASASAGGGEGGGEGSRRISLSEFLRASDAGLASLVETLARACKAIAWEVDQAPLRLAASGGAARGQNASGDEQKELDVVANDIILRAVAADPACATAASEEEDEAVDFPRRREATAGQYALVFDPLDGSRNIECNIPTGTIFGIYPQTERAKGVLRPGSELAAAGYVLYSSSCLLVLTVGEGTHGFTLDRATGEFVLTHPRMRIPDRGQIYSVNDARYFDWPEGLQRYIDTIRKGEGQHPKQYVFSTLQPHSLSLPPLSVRDVRIPENCR